MLLTYQEISFVFSVCSWQKQNKGHAYLLHFMAFKLVVFKGYYGKQLLYYQRQKGKRKQNQDVAG